MTFTDIAYIKPLEPFTCKDKVLCQVLFMSGKHNQERVKMVVPTNIFQYYFWGVTFEVVTYDENFNCKSIRDLQKEDIAVFDIGVCHAMTYNVFNGDILGSNGFVYNLQDNLLSRNYPEVSKFIHQQICQSSNFAMIIHTLRGAMINVLFASNLSEKDVYYKYALCNGFVPMNKAKLRSLVPKTPEEFDKKKLLTQDEIDKLIRDMSYSKS